MTSHPISAITACLALQHAIRSVTGRTLRVPSAPRAPWVAALTAESPASAGFSAAVAGVAGGVLSCIKAPFRKTGELTCSARRCRAKFPGEYPDPAAEEAANQEE